MRPQFAAGNGRSIPGAVATQGVDARVQFIRKTYAHLAGAIGAFVGLAYLFVNSELGAQWTAWAWNPYQRTNWFIVLGLFMAAGWVANKWAFSGSSSRMQYLGLGLYVVAEVLVMTPLIYIANNFVQDPFLLHKAAVITLIMFGGLSATVFLTKKDFSFLGGILRIGMLGAFGLIVVSYFFPINLGTWFMVALIGLASGYVLYYTSAVMQQFPPTYHVAAALALFSAIALMFYYVLMFLMSMARD